MEPKDQKVAVITGSSTGIGLETCLLFARNGILTYATMRDLTKADLIKNIAEKENLPLKVIQMDVDKDNSVVRAFKEIYEDHDKGMGIDILVNNAGFGLFGVLEDQSTEHIKKQFETNFFGAIRTIQQVLPIMKNQRSGTIVNISSISGQIGFPAQSVYVITKFALEGLSESFAYEVEPYRISVVLIEPGVINSNFVENIMIPDNMQPISSHLLSTSCPSASPIVPYSGSPESTRGMSEYANVVERFLSHYYPAMRNAPPPKEVANVILESINDSVVFTRQGGNNNFYRCAVGEDAKLYTDIKRKMSDSGLRSFIAKRILS
ncbi:MAG: SDR family oxidoreductase [Thermoproteota archaeon]|nr:SDR family oxidoreductase [Thermoproteota archaeon]